MNQNGDQSKQIAGPLIFSHETHSSTLRMDRTKRRNRIAINGKDKRLSIKRTTRDSRFQQRLCSKYLWAFSNQVFTINMRQKKEAHVNNPEEQAGFRQAFMKTPTSQSPEPINMQGRSWGQGEGRGRGVVLEGPGENFLCSCELQLGRWGK